MKTPKKPKPKPKPAKRIGDVKEFTVKRSKWARGSRNGDPKLLNKDGNMCCLGFYAKACGVKMAEIRNVGMPKDLAIKLRRRWSHILVMPRAAGSTYSSTNAAISLAQTNDTENYLDSSREEKLIREFADVGITVRFVD